MDDVCIDFEEIVAEDLQRLTSSEANGPYSHSELQHHENETAESPHPPIYESLGTESETHVVSKRTQNARGHFENMRNQCLCEAKRVPQTFFPLARSFANLSQDSRSNSVRAMPLNLSSLPGASNERME